MAHYSHAIMKVEDLFNKEYCESPLGQLEKFLACFPPLIEDIASGKEFTDDELLKLPYAEYLYSRLNHVHRRKGFEGIDWRGRKNILRNIHNGIDLYRDIKEFGLKAPLEMYKDTDGRMVLARGRRRLTIIKKLGYETVLVRKYRSRELFFKYSQDPIWTPGTGDTIHELGKAQFGRLQEKSTDKYWLHNYLPYYDRHIGHLRNKKNAKILELGVKRGASLLLWKEAFPRAQIYGADRDTDAWHEMLADEDRIEVFIGNFSDDNFLALLAEQGPFDIVIDDGSHRCEHQIWSFEYLRPVTTGVYVIEDLRSGSYLRKWKRPKGMPTTIDYLKKLINVTNRHAEIRNISFYYNICFIEFL